MFEETEKKEEDAKQLIATGEKVESKRQQKEQSQNRYFNADIWHIKELEADIEKCKKKYEEKEMRHKKAISLV